MLCNYITYNTQHVTYIIYDIFYLMYAICYIVHWFLACRLRDVTFTYTESLYAFSEYLCLSYCSLCVSYARIGKWESLAPPPGWRSWHIYFAQDRCDDIMNLWHGIEFILILLRLLPKDSQEILRLRTCSSPSSAAICQVSLGCSFQVSQLWWSSGIL